MCYKNGKDVLPAVSLTVVPPVKLISIVTTPKALVDIEDVKIVLTPLLLTVPAMVMLNTINSAPVPLVINVTLFVAAEKTA